MNDYPELLHFDDVLQIFGFSAELSLAISNAQRANIQPDEAPVSYGGLSLKWLSSMFTCFGPVGAVADVVNLAGAIFGMPADRLQQMHDEKANIRIVLALLKNLENLITIVAEDTIDLSRLAALDTFERQSASSEKIWIPTHMSMDSETDDNLALVIILYLRHRLGVTGTFNVLVQLPAPPEVETTDDASSLIASSPTARSNFKMKWASQFADIGRVMRQIQEQHVDLDIVVELWADAEARNARAVMEAWYVNEQTAAGEDNYVSLRSDTQPKHTQHKGDAGR